ncbi:hypothetical protein METH109765_14685 [Mesobacillus thioparans]
MKKERQGIKVTAVIYNAIIIASVIVALTSGFKVV